ncbi:hypothetical protein C0Q70_13318 [Pomacea canaliculata]|uniref:Uncharacterized protein n=1 Tax=Pomacea canaliculata TaxID=400727 RepID=A0A2T7NWW1_POMCA|nr:hypothetical protein C0Q70_13318 [Pomacea canaliculata]
MDRIGATLKQRYSKPCCIKVGIGVGVAVLLLVVVVVAATVASSNRSSSGADDGNGGGGGGSSNEAQFESTAAVSQLVTQGPKQTKLENTFLVKLDSDGFHQLLAVDDSTQTYVAEIDKNEYFNLYIIVDFKKRQHVYVGVEKSENNVRTAIVETRVLFCHNSPFDVNFNGLFTSASRLRVRNSAGGKTYTEQVSGRPVTLDVSDAGSYSMSTILTTVFIVSNCSGDTTETFDTPTCSSVACPSLPELESAQSLNQACKNFRKCNYYMGRCDNYWAASTYDQRPYCVCRSEVLEDLKNINCPRTANDGGECELPKRNLVDFEAYAPCYCKYQISRIYPTSNTSGSVGWVVNAIFTTAPARSYKQCPC